MDAAEQPLPAKEWEARYSAIRSRHEDYASKLRGLLLELLGHASIDTEAVEARAKTVDSFGKKVKAKGQQYQDPLLEMPDLVGLRIVTFIFDDAIAVRQVLKDNFEIEWDRSSIGIGEGDPDRFGYVSDHYQVRLRPERAMLPEWEKFADLCAEIQVRTVLQHAWAAISHKLQYKAEQEVPRELRRQLSRISALLEVADKEFSELTETTIQLDADYVAALEAGKLDIEINADSLAAFLKVTQRHMHYSEVAEEVGYARFYSFDERAADWSLQGFHPFVDLVLLGADVTERSTLADLDQLIPEPVPDHIRAELKRVLDATKGLYPSALPVVMLTLGYALALRHELDPYEVVLTAGLISELSDGLEAVLSDPDAAGE